MISELHSSALILKHNNFIISTGVKQLNILPLHTKIVLRFAVQNVFPSTGVALPIALHRQQTCAWPQDLFDFVQVFPFS